MDNESVKNTKRYYGVDLIKILGATLVVSIHQVGRIGFYSNPVGSSKGMMILTGLMPFLLSCVPLFLIASGFLLSNRKIERSHFRKLGLFLLECLLILLFCQIGIAIFTNNYHLLSNLKSFLLSILSPPYYICLYICLYLFSPFINKLYFSLNHMEKKLLLTISIFFVSMPGLINAIPSVELFDARFTNLWPILYYLIGLYIVDYKPKFKLKYGLSSIVLLGVLYAIVVQLIKGGNEYGYIHVVGYYDNIFTFISATVIFVLLYQIEINNIFLRKTIICLSTCTLSYYVYTGMFTDTYTSMFYTMKNILTLDMCILPLIVIISLLLATPFALITYVTNKHVQRFIIKKGKNVKNIVMFK